MDRAITKQDILNQDPCHCIEKYNITEPISLISILKRDDVEDDSKIWVASKFLDDRTNRLFAVWCARTVLDEDSDPRSIEAIDVAERYANGNATDEELLAAWSAADAAYSAADIAARLTSAAASLSDQIDQLIKMIEGDES